MNKFIKINLITLAATFLVYFIFLRNRDSEFAKAIKSTLIFQEARKRLFAEAGREVLKIVGAYFLLQTLKVR